ncbi:ferric reductase like transmembrane component-domain-containing protein [Calycina marina]|uniref:Ferric reductase like transmembrane component-domain-containing protein n=1 Tax=Calycina marina TaxID=1763456 RepID=A0A9P7Z5R6_9HELO|nr:ferric reductase like transmembrane component-domain-containing protein [Calycina marina]
MLAYLNIPRSQLNDTYIRTEVAPYATGLGGVNEAGNHSFRLADWLWLGLLAVIVLIIRLLERANRHQRHMTAMNLSADQQRFWKQNKSILWWIKKHITYAPIGKTRHNREFKLSSAVNMGTLPSRLHAAILLSWVLINIIACVYLEYSGPNPYRMAAELRGRSGYLALMNVVPLVLLAGRNNPLISWLQISFDTYNLIHRWLGRVVTIEAVVHTCAWAYVKLAETSWEGIRHMIATDAFIGYGTLGTVCLLLIAVLSLSPLRHAFYETFLNIHITLASLTIVAIFVHIKLAGLLELSLTMLALIVIWSYDRFMRLFKLIMLNRKGNKWTIATITALPGEASRVTLHLPRYVKIHCGTHAYLRFAGLNVWESHPFSIAWTMDHLAYFPKHEMDTENGEGRIDFSKSTTDVDFVVHAQTGITRRLYNKAKASGGTVTVRAAIEGPYAGHHSLSSYGHAILFAGSSGISHQLPFVQCLLKGYVDGTVATRKVTLIWIIRHSEHLEWVRPYMEQILPMKRRKELLTIKIYVTRPRNAADMHSASRTVQMFPGRPDVEILVKEEVAAQVGAMCVTVCGPGTLADGVRKAVRQNQETGTIDFIEESFTW